MSILLTGVGASNRYEIETIRYMRAIGVPNDGTVYFAGTAQEITGAQAWEVFNVHFLELKGKGEINNSVNLLPLFIILRPYFGGSATTNKFNAKNPSDTDGAFRQTYFGGLTHSRLGCKGNGTNGYALNYLVPSVNLQTSNLHFSCYFGENGPDNYEMGIFEAGKHIYLRKAIVANVDNGCNSAAFTSISPNSKSVIFSRNNNLNFDMYKNGVKTNVVSAVGVLSNLQFPSFALNDSGSIGNYTANVHCYETLGIALTDQQADLTFQIIEKLQIDLGRDLYV